MIALARSSRALALIVTLCTLAFVALGQAHVAPSVQETRLSAALLAGASMGDICGEGEMAAEMRCGLCPLPQLAPLEPPCLQSLGRPLSLSLAQILPKAQAVPSPRHGVKHLAARDPPLA